MMIFYGGFFAADPSPAKRTHRDEVFAHSRATPVTISDVLVAGRSERPRGDLHNPTRLPVNGCRASRSHHGWYQHAS